jgi:hypothetical protein
MELPLAHTQIKMSLQLLSGHAHRYGSFGLFSSLVLRWGYLAMFSGFETRMVESLLHRLQLRHQTMLPDQQYQQLCGYPTHRQSDHKHW